MCVAPLSVLPCIYAAGERVPVAIDYGMAGKRRAALLNRTALEA
jgi:hypothetical protein